MHIIFVCTGNTCRSSMAEGLAIKLARQFGLNDWTFQSAGLSAYPGLPASTHAISVMKEYQVDITRHKSRQLTRELAAKADMIITMTGNHKDIIVCTMPEFKENTFLLKDFSEDDKGKDVLDPYGQAIESYRKVAEEIKDCIKILMQKGKK